METIPTETEAPVLKATNISVHFAVGHQILRAVDEVSLEVRRGETVALVGESGSGKSTIALALMRAQELDGGSVEFEGRNISNVSERNLKPIRRRLQMVIQDPYASLDPRLPVRRIIAGPLIAHGIGNRAEQNRRVDELMDLVGLPSDAGERYPAHFSGGQRQRISIARALALEPAMIIADEPVSALDMSIQAQVINLLEDIQKAQKLSYLVISHDLALVHHLSDRVIVLYLGRVVEEGPTDDVVWNPQHPYTVAFLSATPSAGIAREDRIVLQGEPPSAIDRPSGCSFHPRCPIARDRCAVERPPLVEISPGQSAACFYPGELQVPIASQSRTATAPKADSEGETK